MADVESLKSGDRQAFDEIYKEFSPRLYNFILSIVGTSSDSQDILQNVFIKVWEKRADLIVEKNFEAYIYTIARHHVYNHLRAKLYTHLVPADGVELADNSSIEQSIFQKDVTLYFKDIINRLPEKRREIFIMNKFQDMSYKEIAEKLSISENTVDTQLRRAMAFLKSKISASHLSLFIALFINS